MIFLAALTTFWIETSDVTVVTCDADWMDKAAFEQMLTAELSELADDERQGMIATVDRCEEDSVRLRVVKRNRGHERNISIVEIPREAGMRTVALAIGELAREADGLSKTDSDAAKTCPNASQTLDRPTTDTGKTGTGKTAATIDRSETEGIGEGGKARTKEAPRFSIGLLARGFPLAATIAPEARFGLFFSKWRLSIGGYGIGWRSALGTAYLTAFTLMGGPTLWRYDGRISVGLDLLTELGAALVFGKADEGIVYTPKFNIAAGLHLAFRLGPNLKKRFRPVFSIEGGWLRGLQIYAADTYLGGFEGLSLAGGLFALW